MISFFCYIVNLFFLLRSTLSQNILWTSENSLTLLEKKYYSTWKEEGYTTISLFYDDFSDSYTLDVQGTQTTVTFTSIEAIYQDYSLNLIYICPGGDSNPTVYRYSETDGLTRVGGDSLSLTTIHCVFVQEKKSSYRMGKWRKKFIHFRLKLCIFRFS